MDADSMGNEIERYVPVKGCSYCESTAGPATCPDHGRFATRSAGSGQAEDTERTEGSPYGENDRMEGKARMALEGDLVNRPPRAERGPDATKYESALSVIEALRRVLEQAELESAEARTELTLQEAKLAKAGEDIGRLREELKRCDAVLIKHHGDHEEGDCPADVQAAFTGIEEALRDG